MTSTSVLKGSIGFFAMALGMLVAFKPHIDADFHASCLKNAWALNSMPDEVARQQLLVLCAEVMH